MILPSHRYVLPTVVLLLVAAAPATLGALRPRLHDPCADPQALRETGAIPGSRDEGEQVTRLSRERIQWSEGIVLDDQGRPTPLRFHVIRDFDGRGFFVRPFGAAAQTMEPESQGSHRIETAAGPVEVHRAVDGTVQFTRGARIVASWAFLYGNEPVGSPLLAKLRHAPTEVVRGKQPLTLLLVGGALPAERADALLDRSDAWLRDAVERHVAVCGKG